MNTTFTNYAEKKAKQFLNLLQGYTKGIRITAILILLLMGVSNAWAASEGSSWYDWASSEHVYFDNTNSSYSNVSMLIGRQWTYGGDGVGSSGVNFTKVANTNNLYHAATTWNHYNTLLFMDETGWGWEGNKVTQRYTYAKNYTNTNNININGTELFYAASSTKGATLNHQDLSGYAALNYQQTIQSAVNGAVANSKATISITSYKMTAHKTTTKQTASLGTGSNVSYITAARTATTTLTVGDVEAGYQFDGWYAAKTGGTALSTSTTYTYYPTAATTVYARFSTKQHTVNFKVHSSGHGSLTAKVGDRSINYGDKVSYGSEVVFTAKPDDGYQIEGWYSNSACTEPIDNGTNKTYTVTIKGGTNVYVKFVEIPVNSHNITYTAQGTGWTYGNSNPTTAEEGATVTFVVNPTAGYRVDVSSDGPTLTGPNANNQYTFTMPTKDVKITVDAKPEQYTVTLNKQSGTGGTSSVTATYLAAMQTITPPTRTGYTFGGYYTATNGGGTQYYKADGTSAKTWTETSVTTLYAKWTATNYTIKYNLNGGTNHASNPANYTIETENITLQAPTKTGHTFIGWFDNEELTGNAVTQITKGSTGNKTYWAKWEVASYTVTFDAEGGNGGTTILTVQYGAQLPNITIPTKDGHLFLGYYNGDDGTGTQYYDASGKGLKTMPANNLTLHAKWLNSGDCIFFYNNLGWSNVYVYFYSSDKYWDDSKGTGSQKEKTFPQDGDADHKPHYREYRGKMTKIEGTNIWYYNRTVHGDITRDNYTTVAFTRDQQYNYEFFYDTEVVRRGDFNSNVPMFVSMKENKVTKNNNKTSYYNTGYWMNYPTNTGYTLKIYNQKGDGATEWRSIPFEYSEDMMMPLTLSVSGMEGGKTYGFKILRADNKWYGNNGTITTGHSGDAGQTAWEFTTDTKNCGLTTTAAGTYVFTLKYGKDANKNYNYLVGVEYPASLGDYRLAYKDNAHPFHPGHLLKKRAGSDIVSFFVHYNENPVIMLQQVTAINANTGAITWETLKTYALTANQPVGDNPGQAMISGRRNADEVILHIGDEHMDGVDATGIYNFVLEQTDSEATLQNTATKYTGNFYIRTDAAAGGWGNIRQNGNKMTYTSYADNQGFNFNHYFVKWINAGTNVKFTIANDYSYCLSDTLDADDIVTTGNLPAEANVRFGWNSKTNELTRAYIAGSSNASDRFLVLEGNDYLKDINGNDLKVSGLNPNEAIFSDKQNWLYQLDVKANNNTEITLTAKYNKKVQTFFSTSKSGEVMQATNEDYHKVRMIYDFKTNNLIAAWLLDETQYPDTTSVASNMLIIRENQGVANQINFSNIDNDDMKIQTAYAVMTFTKTHIDDTELSERERSEYWVSFPFDVNLSDVFGFSEYGDKWIMLLYDGAERAEKGYWKESKGFWKYITNRNYTLRKGVGYVLKLNLNKMDFPNNSTDASLFFPSQDIPTVINAEPTPITVPAHTCTIERDNRNIYDSHWNLIGVPGYANLENLKVDKLNQTVTIENEAHNLAFYYEYDAAKNSYNTSLATATFKNMYAYMVQYAGNLEWTNIQETPAQLAARHNSDAEPEKAIFRLELAQGEEKADQTFVQLQQEGATADFDMNVDMTKIFNSGANIYTLVGSQCIQTAGNALPFSQTVVPVGVSTTTDGEYTFRMPDGTEGMVVELIDYELETTTNLLLFDYTVTLPAGSNESRFALHIQPSKSGVTTGVENVGDKAKGIEKYLIDGKLIIRTAEGEVFDAQGHRL